MAKIQIILQFWGLYSHISALINVKFGTGEQTAGQRVAPAGRKTYHWTTE